MSRELRFTKVTDAAHARFVEGQERVLVTQLPAYAAVKRADGSRVEIVGVVEGSRHAEELVAAAAVVFQPWKRLFSRVLIPFGPVLDWEDTELVEFFFTELRRHLALERRVLAIQFNPLLARRFYEDVKPGAENPAAAKFEQWAESFGFKRIHKEFYDDSSIQIRFMYTKDIEGMTFDDVVKSVDQPVRTGFNKWGTNGVQVRFLGPDEFHVFEEVISHTADRTDMQHVSGSSMKYYRDLFKELGPQKCFVPAAVLVCSEYLEQIAAERSEIDEQKVEFEGRDQLSKKQRKALNELNERLKVLDKRESQTREIQAEAGDEIVLAASYFVATPSELIYLLSGAYREYQSYQGIYLIHRAMLEWATEHAIKRYNTFGITGDFSEDASDAGVLNFKRSFNGDVEELVGTYAAPVRPMIAKALAATE